MIREKEDSRKKINGGPDAPFLPGFFCRATPPLALDELFVGIFT